MLSQLVTRNLLLFLSQFQCFAASLLSFSFTNYRNTKSESCPFCRGSLKRVNSEDLWVLTCNDDVVDNKTVSQEDLLRFYLYINSLPKDCPDALFLVYYEYLIWFEVVEKYGVQIEKHGPSNVHSLVRKFSPLLTRKAQSLFYAFQRLMNISVRNPQLLMEVIISETSRLLILLVETNSTWNGLIS